MEVHHLAYAHVQPYRHEVTYEATLRAIGAFLDEQHGSRVRVKALADGFEVSYDREPGQPKPTRRVLRQNQLAARARGPHAAERRLSRKDTQNRLNYENLFRSLGRELQEASGHLLVLEEVDDDVLLTYQHQGRASDTAPQTRRVVLKRADAWSLLAGAIERRKERSFHTVPLHAGREAAG